MSRASREARVVLDSFDFRKLVPSTYAPYSGPDVTCPKCGNKGAATRYLSHGSCIHGPGGSAIVGLKPNERLHRECERCSYAWDEAVAA